jgi:hypothetical protein
MVTLARAPLTSKGRPPTLRNVDRLPAVLWSISVVRRRYRSKGSGGTSCGSTVLPRVNVLEMYVMHAQRIPWLANLALCQPNLAELRFRPTTFVKQFGCSVRRRRWRLKHGRGRWEVGYRSGWGSVHLRGRRPEEESASDLALEPVGVQVVSVPLGGG